jgi:hypothetical protein
MPLFFVKMVRTLGSARSVPHVLYEDLDKIIEPICQRHPVAKTS